MKATAILLLIGLLVANTNRIIAQTIVPLAGACTDCAAVITAFNNCSVASAGTLKAGTVVGIGVTQTIQLTVGKVGKYSLSTTNNGVTFAASGTFTALGLQTVVLTASGYTVSGGTTTFTLSSKSQSCTFDRTVGGPTTVITGPCPSNLKFWKTDSYYNRYAISTDSVLYAMPYVLYGINNQGYGSVAGYRPETMIISPTKLQNLPKMVSLFANYSVGVDGHIYLVTLLTGDTQYLDVRNASLFPYYSYPFTYVGKVSPYDDVHILKFPLPPTGTKWIDISVVPNGVTPMIFALTDSGDMYALQGGNYTSSVRHLVKLPTPFGTNPSTFKYTKFQGALGTNKVVIAGNDSNYYSFATNHRSNTYTVNGWGAYEITAPDSDFPSGSSVAEGFFPATSSQIRKMQFPAGTVLAENSSTFTVDGKLFDYGPIAISIKTVTSPGGFINQSSAYFRLPLKDGDYTYDRPDMEIFGNTYYRCTTPREVALPVGATKFVSAEIIAGRATENEWWQAGTFGSSALVALTDNGSYGLHPQKVNSYFPTNQLANMEQAVGLTSPAEGNVYYPKYVPSLPGFAEYHIPRNTYGLGLDGTAYRYVDVISDQGGNVYAPVGRYWNNYRPTTTIYSLLLNGNCDYNNPYPEP